MTTLEGNKLIAEFMEYRYYTAGGLKYTYLQKFNVEFRTWDTLSLKGDELFHSSWDWLMPVVEKIYLTGISGSLMAELQAHLCAVNIKEVHKCTVEFIQWHNTQ